MKIHTSIEFFKIRIASIILLCFTSAISFAQKDSTKKTTIDITSSYKPVLRNAVKINSAASQLNVDSTKPKLNYTVPSQNLFYSYQPISLKPLALEVDTNLSLGLRNYIKAGFGNFATPSISAGFSFGNGKKSLLNLYANYIASKGQIQYQDYSQLNIKATGSFFMPKQEVYGAVSMGQNDTYLYGYNHTLYPNYTKTDLLNQYQDINLKIGIRNTVIGEYGIKYNPTLQINNFVDKNKYNESTIIATAPIEKQFGEAFAIKILAKADITSYTTQGIIPNNIKLSNNVFQIAPSVSFSTPRLSVNGGLIPTWDNGNFVWLPNVFAEGQIQGKSFLFQAGWVGTYTKNTMHNLVAQNPYLQTALLQNNTKEIEYYGGIKTTFENHFNFSVKAGFINYTNLPIFINDTAADNKSFKIIYAGKASNFRIHGDFSYVNQDKFTLTTGLTFNGYTGFSGNTKAWNTVPLEITSALRWWAFKQVMFKADLYFFGGGNYLAKGNITNSFTGGTDLSLGTEFKVSKMFSAWIDVNNVLNNKYQRWHNYEVYGLNFIGGVKLNF